MKKVQILGSGCSKCETTALVIAEVAEELGVSIELEKVRDVQAIAAAGVLRTPAVTIDGRVVHAGSVPNWDEVEQWLRAG
jgi:small redox-active disulfide protein 2